MSISLRTQSQQPQALHPALSAAASAQGWQPIPQINQLHPRGADQNYVNGAYNCAPAVVAMLARGHGKMGDLNDAQLIQQLGQDIVTEKGTDPQGVATMLERADVPLAGDALAANYSGSGGEAAPEARATCSSPRSAPWIATRRTRAAPTTS